MELQEYKPMLEVKTYSGDVYYILEANKANLFEIINRDKFVDLNGSIVACRDIKSVKPPKNNNDLVLVDFPEYVRKATLEMAQEKFKLLLRYPSAKTLLMWANKINNGERII